MGAFLPAVGCGDPTNQRPEPPPLRMDGLNYNELLELPDISYKKRVFKFTSCPDVSSSGTAGSVPLQQRPLDSITFLYSSITQFFKRRLDDQLVQICVMMKMKMTIRSRETKVKTP